MHDALSPMPQDSLAGLRQAMAEMVSGNAARWRAFWRGDAAKRADMEQEEVEVPEWLGGLLHDAVEASNGLLIKGAGHKYLRRVPKAGGGWRYFYTVTGGQGLGHHSEMVRGAAFKVKDAGQEGHFHVEEDHGDEVTLRHDESGKTSRISKKALAGMLHAEHAEAVGAVKQRAAANLEQARKTGTAKQQERAAALVSKYAGAAEKRPAVGTKEINAALKADPIAALKKYGQDMAGQILQAKVTQVDGDSWSSRTGPKIKTAKQRFIVLGSTPEGLRVLSSRRKHKDPAPHESVYYYDNEILPWKDLSNEAPSLEDRTENWREAQSRIKLDGASLDGALPAHSLGLAEIQQIAERMDPQSREALWGTVASPEDAALLASSPQGVSDAAFNIYKHLRDAGASVDSYSRPGTYRLLRGGRTLEQSNREETATIAELIRTGKPSSASVETAAQRALDEKGTPLYLVNTERMQREILRQQASEARSPSMAKSMSHRMEVVGAEEVELPEWLGEALYSDENGVLIKGAGHKYIRRVPKAGGGWRYFYTVTGGHGLGHHAEMVVGAAFKIRSREGQEGHVHILEDHGDEVTLRHDESGKSARVSKATLAAMLHREHAEAVGKVRERASKTLEQAQKTGTAKQQSRAAALVEKYSGAAKPSAKPSPKAPEPPAADPEPPAAAPSNAKLSRGVEMAWPDLGIAQDLKDVAFWRGQMRRRNAANEQDLLGGHTDAEVLAEVQRRQRAGQIPGQSEDGTLDPTSPAFHNFMSNGIAPTPQSELLLGVRSGVPGQWKQEPLFANEHYKSNKLLREGNYLTDLNLASYAAQHGLAKPHAYVNKDRTELRRWNGNGWDVYALPSASEAAKERFTQQLRSQAIAWGKERDVTLAMHNSYTPGLQNFGGRGTLGVDTAEKWMLTQDPQSLGLTKTGTLGPETPVEPALSQMPGHFGDSKLVMPRVGASLQDWGRADLRAAPSQAAPAAQGSPQGAPKWTPADAPGRYGVVTPAVLEQVNALPLPKADTRVGQTWRERRHHLGDVSIAAAGAYSVLHDQAHAQLERAWRAKRLEEAGFAPHSVWGQIKNDTARSGGASETVPAGTKPAPFVPPSQIHAGADVQGGAPSGLGRAQSAATRSRPRSRMELQRPVVGPSGAKLTAYEWQHKLVDDVDKRGEDRVRRVSDWDKAAPSEHTGRDIVHHFEVVMPSGEAKTVSAESALDLLGYTSKSERAKVRGLADDMIEHAQASARLDELESANQRFDAAHAAVSADPSTPRAFRPARFEGMWAHHDIGGKSYKTHATIWGTMGDNEKRERMASLHRSFVNELAAERAGLGAVEMRRLESELRPTRERVATLRQRLNDKAAAVGASGASGALGQGSIFKSLVAKYARLVS